MKKLWTTERIKEGFEKFITLNGHVPTASEVDVFEHLPSSRYIQKRFGGLEALRTELGYTDAHFGKGSNRSNIACIAGERSKRIVQNLHNELSSLFTEECIHLEKAFSGRHRIDFYIHTPGGNFGIDIFYAKTMRTLQSSVNIKMKKYVEFTEPLYLTVANEDITQSQLNTYLTNKKNVLPNNIYLVNSKTLRKHLRSYKIN